MVIVGVGGTFTDVVAVDDAGVLRFAKVPSVPAGRQFHPSAVPPSR
jgi:N-methylhydantoinase A/oxoprolinase/acetone carboxylase beta subunit